MKTLKKYILDNWKLKLLSIILAIMLWITVYLIGEMKKEITVPVSISGLSREFVIMKIDTEKIDVTLSGRVSILKDVRDNDAKVLINGSEARDGENIFNITRGNIQIPKGVQIDEIKPSAIKVDLDRIIQKKLRTVVKLEKKWAGKYDVASWSPQYVSISGPARILEGKTVIETNPVGGALKQDQEVISVTLDTEGLVRSKIAPDTVRVILRRHHGKEAFRN
ncbi:MAG TPA: hypothetical protein VMT62_12460 [Syntrophorhabdaceae bacterium]|nr:hypothetical protein [Syntrophorhabdaceae bacterium]